MGYKKKVKKLVYEYPPKKHGTPPKYLHPLIKKKPKEI
jgi:hypothetical protein